jgi:hypothetical protein
MSIWNDTEKGIVTLLGSCTFPREISEILSLLGCNRTPDAVRRQRNRMGVIFRELGYPQEIKNHDIRRATATILGKRKSATPPPVPPTPAEKAAYTRKKTEAFVALRTQLEELRGEIPRTSTKVTRRHSVSSGYPSLCVLLSDFHVGSIVIDELGEEVYNTEVARERIMAIPDSLREHKGKVDEIVLILAGDMIDGETIYPTQPFEIEDGILRQLHIATLSIWDMIEQFQNIFGDVLIKVVTCQGNHGRTTGSSNSNWDNVLYQQIELLADAKANKNIVVVNSFSKTATVDVKGWKGLIRHDGPVQADTSSAKARLGGWYSIHKFDFICYGHWHHWGTMSWNKRLVVRNGCLAGGNDYAEGFGAYDAPVQVAFTVTPEKLPATVIPIVLE